MLESSIEKYLVSRIKQECDGMALKFVSPGFNGVPDRIIFLPGGKIVLAELKAPQKKAGEPYRLMFVIFLKQQA